MPYISELGSDSILSHSRIDSNYIISSSQNNVDTNSDLFLGVRNRWSRDNRTEQSLFITLENQQADDKTDDKGFVVIK